MNLIQRTALLATVVTAAVVASIPVAAATTAPPPSTDVVGEEAAAAEVPVETTSTTTTTEASTTTTSTTTTTTTSTTTVPDTTSSTTTSTTTAPPATVASVPRSLTATPTNVSGQVRLSWLLPASDGGSAVTDYVIQRSPDGTSGWSTIADGVTVATSYTATGLVNGTRYYFRVLATNGVGSSSPSNVVNAVPRTVPSAARTLTATPTNVSGQVRLSWVFPASNGGAALSDYVVERSLNGTSGWTTINDGVGTATAFTVTGLTNGTRHYFRVFARNAAGTSTSSNVVNAVPRALPTAPRSLTVALVASGQLRLSWWAPVSNNGAAVTDYVIQRSPNGTSGWVTVNDGVRTTTASTVTGLANGTRYYFRVFARNAAGLGPASNVVSSVPRAIPTAARSLTVAPTNLSGQLRLSWLAPASNGGLAVTDYLIQRSLDGTTGWITLADGVRTTTTYTATGLTNGTRYYFRVFARNAAGQSLGSNVSSAIPRTVPSAPRTLQAAPTGVSGELVLWWQPPASTGGSAITSYVFQISLNGISGWVTLGGDVITSSPALVSGTVDGFRYYFRVFARNAAGTGPPSNVASAIPRAG